MSLGQHRCGSDVAAGGMRAMAYARYPDAQAEFLAPLSAADRAELTRILQLIVGYHAKLRAAGEG
jgi:hypothetical protein